MKKKGFYIALVIMVGIGLSVFYFIQAGFYPVAIVNSTMIGASEFEDASNSAYHYYVQASKVYSEDDSEIKKQQVIQELRRATLDKMVENVIIQKELSKRLGSDYAQLVNKKVNVPEIGTSNFSKAVLTLYDLTVEEFKEYVLIPQAREELLVDSIREDKNDYMDWIKQERQKASVVILNSEFEWDGERIAVK